MRTIGILLPTVDNSFFSCLSGQLERQFSEAGFTTWISSCGNDVEQERIRCRAMREAGCAGMVWVNGKLSPKEAGGTSLVLVDRIPRKNSDVPCVTNDDEAAIAEATRFLIGKGCRNILLAPGYIPRNAESPRVTGYKAALEESGIAFRTEYILVRKGLKSSEVETEELVNRLLRESYPVDGLITSSDRSAFGAISALRSIGFYVPEDVKLISFDNSPYATLMSPGITALDRNIPAMAACAAQQLMKAMEGKQTEKCNLISFSLIQRESTR